MKIIERYFLKKSSTANLQYDFLDGLRGIAVIFVLLSHLSQFGLNPFHFISFLGCGKYGVFLFFVLSAFLLTLPFLRKSKDDVLSSKLWLNYALRRILRIFPLYVFILLLNFAMSHSDFFFPLSKIELYQHITLQAGKEIFWTIPVETKYYLVLPLVVFSFTLIFKNHFILSTCAVGLALLLICMILWPAAESKMNTVSLGPYLPIFLLGSFSALIHFKLSNIKWMSSPQVKWTFESIALLLITVSVILVPYILDSISNENIGPYYFHKDFLLFGTLWSAFIVCCFYGSGYIRKVLSLKFLRVIGVISFSIYLWHIPVIKFVSQIGSPALLKSWFSILMVILVSALSYLFIEKPFMKIRL